MDLKTFLYYLSKMVLMWVFQFQNIIYLPLLEAAFRGDSGIVKFLLENGADPVGWLIVPKVWKYLFSTEIPIPYEKLCNWFNF